MVASISETERFSSLNPATGEVIGSYPQTDSETIRACVQAARSAGQDWAALPVMKRLEPLRRLCELLSVHSAAVAKAISAEIGKPLQESLGAEVLPSVEALRWLQKNAPRLLQPIQQKSRTVTREPYGVVGVIGTWNYPLYLDLTTIAWAIAAGNTVVWKPSELASGVACVLYQLFQESGLPEGVVILATGDGRAGRALAQSGCDKIAFIGSVQTGQQILSELSRLGIPSVMELSGNDAFIVLEDAPLDLAAQSAVWGRVCNTGQSCVAPQRFYVTTAVYEEFLNRTLTHLRRLRIGMGEEVGPLRSFRLRQIVESLVQDAVDRGARLLAGGFSLNDRPGFFYAPTLLADCRDDMPVMRESFFGPVIAVCRVEDEREAVRCANADLMGLAASVWTQNEARGRRIARQIRAGLVSINDTLLDAGDPSVGFGGFGRSGFGKMRGEAGLREMYIEKVVSSRPVRGARRHLFPYRETTLPLLTALIGWKARQGEARLRALLDLIIAAKNWNQGERS
jgi:acyl-CoA reductase-like NAD-dependent aldehyde dehydrogenase